MNKSDSIDIALSFEQRGYTRATSAQEADVVVLNTCSVRENAEERILGRLGYYRSLKARKNGNMTIVFAGCMAQERGRKIMKLFPEVNIVAGTYNSLNIPAWVQEYNRTQTPLVLVDNEHYDFSPYRGLRAEGYRSWVNIIKGCSNYCSYCIVPYLRGPELSKKSGYVINEIKDLVGRGVVEITLLGQNVNAYGRDSGDISFIELLERINDIEDLKWIRFLTSHPRDFNEGIVKRISRLHKVCKHFHLPLQSGSDRILSLMNRQYTVKHYRSVVDGVREAMPDSSLTTDIIVGFPTESEEDFTTTLNVVSEIGYDDAFTYRYSPRPFTKAAGISGQVDTEISKRRLEELISLQRSISFQKNRKEIGRQLEVLVERKSKKNDREYLCKTETNKMVVVQTNKPAGSFIDIRIEEISGNTLRGVEIDVTGK